MNLGLDETELTSCVQCGLCLPHCPTFRVTGDESRSPRGRIALMRAVQRDGAPLSKEVVASFDTCIQCRGCEPACPSQVRFGHLMEQTRAALVEAGAGRRGLRLALAPLAHPRLLRAGSTGLGAAQRLGLVPRRLGLTRLPLRRSPHRRSGDDVVLFTGCVMDAWQREVHQAAQFVLESAGFGVRPSADAAPCCGALHAHAGLVPSARRRARETIAALAGDEPILVDAAGCGAAMKEYGRLLDTDEARRFSARVFDVHEWLVVRRDRLPRATPIDARVAVQDPCHLRHVQKVHGATRDLLRPYVRELVEIDDDGLCCGAGGAFSVLQPELATSVRARKVAAIEAIRPDVVASANPGCSMHLAAAGVTVAHPMTLIAKALGDRVTARGSNDSD